MRRSPTALVFFVSVEPGFKVYHGVSRASTQRKNKTGRDRHHDATSSKA
jgi:hypothetical protein